MALVTSKEYLDSVKKLKPRVYVGGKWVKNLLENPITKSMVMANAAIYDLAQQPECKEVMVATSHLTGEPINRNLNVARNIHDLDMRQEMALLSSQTVGTCNYRCVGCDALNALASTTWEMDRDLGTKYNERFNNWLKMVQSKDLAVSGAITDAKGDRKKRPSQQEDRDVFLHLVEKRDDGIVVRGYKVSQSGAMPPWHEARIRSGNSCPATSAADLPTARRGSVPTPGHPAAPPLLARRPGRRHVQCARRPAPWRDRVDADR